MRWRSIRCAILFLLLSANIVMFCLLRVQEKGPGNITQAEWEAAREVYEKSGIRWSLEEERIPYYPARVLVLKRTDMRNSARTMLGDEVTETYLYDSVTRYSKDGNVMLVNSNSSSMDYFRNSRQEDKTEERMEEKEAQQAGERFMKDFTPFDIEMELYSSQEEGGERTLTYYQRWQGELLLFNRAELWIDGAGVRRGEFTYYSIEEEQMNTAAEYPLDELLYQCLRKIETAEEPVRELKQIEYAYRVEVQEDEIQGIPCIFLSFDEGVTYVIERIIR